MSDNQENNENCKLRAFERNNYYYGKLMTVRDFELEQRYFNNKRWLINSLVFGSGTVCGLDVEPHGMSITVKSGIAIDRCGHEIVVPADVTKQLDENVLLSGKKKAIYLKYDECPKERVRAQTASTCEEVCANNRTEESYEIDIRDVPESGLEEPDEELCGIWSNHATKTSTYPPVPGSEKIRFKRTVRKYAGEGDLLEVYLVIMNLQNTQVSVLIEDKLPDGVLSVVYGTNSLGQISIQAGETIRKMYVAKINPNPPSSFTITANIDGSDIDDTKSVIEVKSPREISETLITQLIDLWTEKPCFDGKDNTGVKIAELSLITVQGRSQLLIDNTKRKLVYNNKYMAQMLECLRTQVSALEDQSVGIKNKIAPGKILLSPDPVEIEANGTAVSVITITVQNDAGAGLSGIGVNLISTLGAIPNHVTTGPDGKTTAQLRSGTIPGIATVMATTGAGAEVTQVTFTPTTGTINGTVTDKTNNNPIKGATVAVGTITTVTDTDGKYSLPDVPRGNQVVWAFASGYNEATTVVDVKANQENKTDFILTPIPTAGTITGRVTDKNGDVIEKGATVTAGGVTDTTDENGNYTLSNVPTGTHTVTASAEGYQTANRASVEVKPDETTSDIDFKLEPATGAIKGRVTARSITGIKGATVSVVGTSLSAQTDDSGSYVIYNVPLGTQTVTATAQDYNAGTKSVAVEANQTVTLDLQLTPLVTKGAITGRVTTLRGQPTPICTAAIPAVIRDPIGTTVVRPIDTTVVRPIDTTVVRPIDTTVVRPIDTTVVRPIDTPIARSIAEPIPCIAGAPIVPCTAGSPTNIPCLAGAPGIPQDDVGIAGATVSVAGTSLSAVTDASGYYTIHDVPEGTHNVTASAPKYNTGSQSVTVEAGKTTTANFRLTPAATVGTISGRVTTLSGTPLICPAGGPREITPAATGIKGATISVAGTSLKAVTDDAGNYTIPNVPVGTYTVTASAPGYNASTQRAIVNEDQTTTVNFQLTPLPTTGEITGRVTNTEGTPIGMAAVKLNEDGKSVVTDANGFYRHSNVRPGTHTMTASASGYIDSTRTVNVIAGQVTNANFVLNKALCSAGTPRIICTASTPSIVTPICTSGTPDIVTPICTGTTPRVVTPICTAATPNVVTPICTSGAPAIERPVVERPILKRASTRTACPGGRPTIAPKTVEEKEKSQCTSGRPTIALKKDTRLQVKSKGGKK